MSNSEDFKVEIGSEWMDAYGYIFEVLAENNGVAFIKFEDGKHNLKSVSFISNHCKPVPKRRFVWLNVHKYYVSCHMSKESADAPSEDKVLFQQKVEIINPNEAVK